MLTAMGLRRAALLAAMGSVLGLAFSLEENAATVIRAGAMPRFPIDLGLMLLSYFTMASLSLMLIVIYSELAGQNQRLSVKAWATCAAAGYGFLTVWGTYQPFAGRILFRTNLQIVHWVIAVSCLRFGWTVLCAMIASAGGLQKDPRLGRVALALIVLQAFGGIWNTWFQVRYQVRSFLRVWNEFSLDTAAPLPWSSLSWIPRAMAADGIALFEWITLCAFLFEVWRRRVD